MTMLFEMGKWMLIAGGILVAIGGLLLLGYQLGIPLGNLPGDIKSSHDKFSFYFPIVTSIVLSIVLTIIINLILIFLRK